MGEVLSCDAIVKHEEKSRDSFANWAKPARMFNTFYFHTAKVQKANEALSTIADTIKSRLELDDYESHTVNFQGSTQFGTETCWLDLYPKSAGSQRNAYQTIMPF